MDMNFMMEVIIEVLNPYMPITGKIIIMSKVITQNNLRKFTIMDMAITFTIKIMVTMNIQYIQAQHQ